MMMSTMDKIDAAIEAVLNIFKITQNQSKHSALKAFIYRSLFYFAPLNSFAQLLKPWRNRYVGMATATHQRWI